MNLRDQILTNNLENNGIHFIKIAELRKANFTNVRSKAVDIITCDFNHNSQCSYKAPYEDNYNLYNISSGELLISPKLLAYKKALAVKMYINIYVIY